MTDDPIVTSGESSIGAGAFRGGVYRALPGGRPFVIFVVLFLTANLGVFLFQSISVSAQADWGFTVFMLLAYAWVVPQFLLRVVCVLDLQDGVVNWKTAVRSGRFEANDLRALRPMLLGPNTEVLQLRNGRKLFVMIGRGFRELASDLSESAPFAQVEVSSFVEVAERWPGKRSFYERRA